jgi:hypothetical protein
MPATGHTTFVFINQLKKNEDENKNTTNDVSQDLAGDLPFHHAVSIPVWSAVISHAALSKNVYPYSVAGTMDDVCGRTLT